MIEFRWKRWERHIDGQAPFGAIIVGTGCQQYTQVLQYRERENMLEIGIQDPIWSEWKDT